MTELGVVHLAAAIVAVACLLFPLAGRFLVERARRSRYRTQLKPRSIFLAIGMLIGLLAGVAILVDVGGGRFENVQDWVLMSLLCLSIGFGVTGQLFRGTRRVKLIHQIAIAVFLAAFGARIPVTQGAMPMVDIFFSAVFIVSLLNALAVANFIDGFASLVTFLVSACAAVLMNFFLATGYGDQSADVIFALAVCGTSLWFFVFRRPLARAYMADLGTLMLGLALAVVSIRVLAMPEEAFEGLGRARPAVFLPLVLILPMLAAGLHHESMPLFRRLRLALIIVVFGHIPSWAPIVMGEQTTDMASVLLALAAVITWTALIVHGQALRGWSMRCAAEPVANVLRVAAIVTGPELVIGMVVGLDIRFVISSAILTTTLLIILVTWWRTRVRAERLPEVVVFGTHDQYEKVCELFKRCGDLLGGPQCRRARIGLTSKHLRPTVARLLKEGQTVLILTDHIPSELRGMRPMGDLIYARDCLLLREDINRISSWESDSPMTDRLHDLTHRTIALLGLIVLLPVFVLVMVLIRLDDGGPVFFRQRRLGHRNRRFTLIKFRSMRVDAPKYDLSPSEQEDPRITRVGRLLRKLSIDELPQLINVIRGEMRLVGPRPEMPFICSQYTPYQRQRLDIAPGVTGLWQISAHRNDPIHDHVEFDLAYRDHRGPVLDLAILIATFFGGVHRGC